MIRKLPILAFIVISACTVPIPVSGPGPVVNPEPDIPEPSVNPGSAKERFLRATEANGCEFNEQNASIIMAAATLSREDIGRAMTELRAEGRGEIVGGSSFRVTSDLCV